MVEQFHLQYEEPLVLPLEGVWGFAPNRWSKQCGMDIFPIFLLRLGSRKEVLQHFKDKKGPTDNITKKEKEAIKTLREDSSWVVLTADKGVAMVVMDKSQYVEKCMALLNDTKVYKPCKGHNQITSQRHPGISQKAQQRTWIFKTIWLEQNILQQIAPYR